MPSGYSEGHLLNDVSPDVLGGFYGCFRSNIDGQLGWFSEIRGSNGPCNFYKLFSAETRS